MYIVEIERL